MDIVSKLGGRKIFATILVLVTGTAAVFLRGDIPANFLALLQTVLGAFVGGNIAEHWAKNLSAAKSSSPTTTPDKIAGLEAKVDSSMELLGTVGRAVNGLVQSNEQAVAFAREMLTNKNP